MPAPAVRFPDRELVVPLRYFGSVDYYAMMSAYGKTVIDSLQRYDKRDKAVHRMDIADVHGPLSLTLPVGRPSVVSGASWSNVGISFHGDWYHVHRVALESAYGRTPFFEFYIDRFLPFFSRAGIESYGDIASYDIALTATICGILGIPAPETADAVPGSAGGASLRKPAAVPDLPPQPYWQIRAQEFGFLPHLSILDLIFSLGPEAPVYLHRLTSYLPG